MCGIAGSTACPEGFLDLARRLLGHRGPDADGEWRETASGLGFAHTRLAIIDLSPGGAQPMVSDCGRYVITYNGEIFNYRELRAELEGMGEPFRSQSDTEVLLYLLRREGVDGIRKLVGMFAFALWDRERQELLLARDRLGVKPLVYAPLATGHLAFASEIATLRAHPGVDVGLDREALSEYLACLYVPAPRTIHAGIRKLPPGHVLRWRRGTTTVERYWTPNFAGRRAPAIGEAVEEVLPLLRHAVRLRMIADVPVGCFLSGGIDSSVVAALMAEEAKRQDAPPIRTFTMTFAEPAYDEREAARAVAAHVASRHTELPASARLVDRLDDYIAGFGEPFGNPTALLVNDLSRKAREYVTVALVGDGGDEVFAGYPRYQGGRLAVSYRRLPAWLRRGVLGPLSRLIPESTTGRHALRRAREFLSGASLPDDRMYATWVEYFEPNERQRLLGLPTPPTQPIAAIYRQAPSQDPLDAMQQTDLLTFLPGNLLAYGDAMSMRHALELRLPLLDHRVVEAVGALAPGVRFRDGSKTLLKAVARRLLPASIVERPKRGFNPPMGVWLRTDLKAMIEERLTPAAMAATGIEWPPVERLLAEHRRGARDHALKVWALLVLDAWKRAASNASHPSAANPSYPAARVSRYHA
jgi:asparagine synthase (glutamine-hydrolysing)